jgi:hypothetical protein
MLLHSMYRSSYPLVFAIAVGVLCSFPLPEVCPEVSKQHFITSWGCQFQTPTPSMEGQVIDYDWLYLCSASLPIYLPISMSIYSYFPTHLSVYLSIYLFCSPYNLSFPGSLLIFVSRFSVCLFNILFLIVPLPLIPFSSFYTFSGPLLVPWHKSYVHVSVLLPCSLYCRFELRLPISMTPWTCTRRLCSICWIEVRTHGTGLLLSKPSWAGTTAVPWGKNRPWEAWRNLLSHFKIEYYNNTINERESTVVSHPL